MQKNVAQRILNRNKAVISCLLDLLEMQKAIKRDADATGNLEVEYAAHNAVKGLRKELAKMVIEQKQLKAFINKKGI